jgi:methylmalonyl-CoA mutase cobalamin-binding subunit
MLHICGVSKTFGKWYQKTNRTEGTAAIQQRVTAVMLSIPKEAFADSFQKLYERCQPCVVKDDDYFEGQ